MFDGKLLVPSVLRSVVTVSIIIEIKSISHPLYVPIYVLLVFLFRRCQTDKNQDDERRHMRHTRNFTINGEVIFFRIGIIPKRLQKSSRSVHISNLVTEVGGPQGKNKINIRGISSGNFDIIYFKIYFLLLSENGTSAAQEIICEKISCFMEQFLNRICVPKITKQSIKDDFLLLFA
jgi:hypothetical protein